MRWPRPNDVRSAVEVAWWTAPRITAFSARGPASARSAEEKEGSSVADVADRGRSSSRTVRRADLRRGRPIRRSEQGARVYSGILTVTDTARPRGLALLEILRVAAGHPFSQRGGRLGQRRATVGRRPAGPRRVRAWTARPGSGPGDGGGRVGCPASPRRPPMVAIRPHMSFSVSQLRRGVLNSY